MTIFLKYTEKIPSLNLARKIDTLHENLCTYTVFVVIFRFKNQNTSYVQSVLLDTVPIIIWKNTVQHAQCMLDK
jgi:hypothetical protein